MCACVCAVSIMSTHFILGLIHIIYNFNLFRSLRFILCCMEHLVKVSNHALNFYLRCSLFEVVLRNYFMKLFYLVYYVFLNYSPPPPPPPPIMIIYSEGDREDVSVCSFTRTFMLVFTGTRYVKVFINCPLCLLSAMSLGVDWYDICVWSVWRFVLSCAWKLVSILYMQKFGAFIL